MEFYDVINTRRTIRDFTDQPVDDVIIKRILNAGLKAPSNDHLREWEFVVIKDREKIAELLKKIPKRVSEKRVEFITKSWKLNDEQQVMYNDAIPKQYIMLSESNCLILPFYKQKADLLTPKDLSSLNYFASIWCCIENIFLSATAEGLACAFRIPFSEETKHISEVINHPKEYFMPCYIALGYQAPDAVINEQIAFNIEDKIHFNNW